MTLDLKALREALDEHDMGTVDLCDLFGDFVQVLSDAADLIALLDRLERAEKALGALLNCVDGVHDHEWLDRCKREAFEALSHKEPTP